MESSMLLKDEEEALLEAIRQHSKQCSSADEEEMLQWLVNSYSQRLHSYALYDEESESRHSTRTAAESSSSTGSRLARANALFQRRKFKETLDVTRAALRDDPFLPPRDLVVHVSALAEANETAELFACAHRLVENAPRDAASWYAVGCYYFASKLYDESQRFMARATSLDPSFGPAWLGFGHAFSLLGEHDQAVAAYRTAARIMIGSHLPELAIAHELLRVANLPLAMEFLQRSVELCADDPTVHNELGVLHYKDRKYADAIKCFMTAIKLCAGEQLARAASEGSISVHSFTSLKLVESAPLEPALTNLAHCYRELELYREAEDCYRASLSLRPSAAGTMSALGLTHHLQGHFNEAIDLYHSALCLNPESTLTTRLLQQAIERFSASQASFIRKNFRALSLEDASTLLANEDDVGLDVVLPDDTRVVQDGEIVDSHEEDDAMSLSE